MAHAPGTWQAADGRRRPGAAPGGPAVVLDSTAKLIIEQLQQDGRRSYAAIGKAVGLSEAAVRQRVQRLADTGVMQIVAVTDPLTLGFRRQAMIGIRSEGDLERVAAHLAVLDEIDYVVITAGAFVLLAEGGCEDGERLREVLSRGRAAPAATGTESFAYLERRSRTYSWGTRCPDGHYRRTAPGQPIS